MTESPKIKILFLCTGNSARSQMAEAWLRMLGDERFDVFSAGLEPHGVNPFTVRVMEETGYSMQSHRSKHIDEFIGAIVFDHLITVCGNADKRCPVFPGMGKRQHWPFDDPAAFEGTDEQKLAFFRSIRDQIKARIEAWLAEEETLA